MQIGMQWGLPDIIYIILLSAVLCHPHSGNSYGQKRPPHGDKELKSGWVLKNP